MTTITISIPSSDRLVVGREGESERIGHGSAHARVDHHDLTAQTDLRARSLHVDRIRDRRDHHRAGNEDDHEHRQHHLPWNVLDGLVEEHVLSHLLVKQPSISHLEEDERIGDRRGYLHRLLCEVLRRLREVVHGEVVQCQTTGERGGDARVVDDLRHLKGEVRGEEDDDRLCDC